ncbi:MAG: TonB family protein [Cytophagales bacterium]|jgi:TonB family protein|nr:TonB family protein [Cytophagales bacterium]MCA6389564.1 TonB family protein [Cytophagales bacterium]MCA6392688.1 TonB family protein [Cytophagales bacterium]MCA6394493.1 TonB family protein [Cytophagales bacterium]MCA6397480.1 TonB family protein [Cytophagales bacterium]
MNATINYLLEVNVGLLLFMFVYWAGLRDETEFTFKRAYLLFALISSLTFPLFHFNVPASTQAIASIGQLIPTYWLPEIVINSNGSASTAKVSLGLSIWTVTEWVYLIAILFLVVLFFYRIISIVKLFSNSHTYRWRNYFVSETNEAKPTFSFFQLILIGQANQLDEKEKEEILIHESIHIKKWHSLDILLVNMVGIVCWFNPIIKIYKKELVQLHEFEADARSVENKDVEMYCGLLAKVALQSADFPLANHFNNSLTLKRINMMKTMKHKIQNWKMAALMAIVPIFFFVAACQDQVTSQGESAENSSGATAEYKKAFEEIRRLEKENPDKTYVLLVTDASGKQSISELENARLIAKINTVADEQGHFFAIFEKYPVDVFTIVEETATPKEGLTAFYEYVKNNLRYPAEARRKGVEGKVFVQFVINIDGSLSEFKVVKGIGSGCDEEAVRIIKESPAWNPGKQRGIPVKQRYTMPFLFRLSPQSSTSQIGEIQSNDETMSVAITKAFDNGKLVLTGQVLRNNDGLPLPGVNLVIKNGQDGAVTDSDGRFKFQPPIQQGAIVFSFVGFKSQEISF